MGQAVPGIRVDDPDNSPSQEATGALNEVTGGPRVSVVMSDLGGSGHTHSVDLQQTNRSGQLLAMAARHSRMMPSHLLTGETPWVL